MVIGLALMCVGLGAEDHASSRGLAFMHMGTHLNLMHVVHKLGTLGTCLNQRPGPQAWGQHDFKLECMLEDRNFMHDVT